MKIGRRKLIQFRRRLLDAKNYGAVLRFFRVHARPFRILADEVFSLGTYPRTIVLQTPTGPASVQLFSAADLSTLNLIFCRQDYFVPEDSRVVVDIGSNIGLSALFWLTRNRSAYVYCYEPAPTSYQRLLDNLQPWQGRFVAHRQAVSDFTGVGQLGLEASGVYSSLDRSSPESVPCEVVHINDVLGPVIRQHGQIDVLKVDSEGHELRTVQALAPEYWKHIRCLNIDSDRARSLVPGEFDYSHVGSAGRFVRRVDVGGARRGAPSFS
jgi:FkbM family methyltransferase